MPISVVQFIYITLFSYIRPTFEDIDSNGDDDEIRRLNYWRQVHKIFYYDKLLPHAAVALQCIGKRRS